jgi:hypothetical protein
MDKLKDVFRRIEAATKTVEVSSILDDVGIDHKYRIDEGIYPELQFKITKEELLSLKNSGGITFDNLIGNPSDADVLTRLLYSVLWKNGDLRKVKHIIDGILEDESVDKESGLVFYQFGKYLTKSSGEPLIDQHVLRAFGMYKAKDDEEKIKYFKRLSLVTKKEKALIVQYKSWLQNDLTEELRSEDNYLYHVDKVLFAVGKSVKEKTR